MNITVCVETTGGGQYSHLLMVEDGRPIMRAHCGDPVLDWRLIDVVMRAFEHLGRTVALAEDFDQVLGRLGYYRADGAVVKGEAVGVFLPADIPVGI